MVKRFLALVPFDCKTDFSKKVHFYGKIFFAQFLASKALSWAFFIAFFQKIAFYKSVLLENFGVIIISLLIIFVNSFLKKIKKHRNAQ